jgi:hypothetical protein
MAAARSKEDGEATLWEARRIFLEGMISALAVSRWTVYQNLGRLTKDPDLAQYQRIRMPIHGLIKLRKKYMNFT